MENHWGTPSGPQSFWEPLGIVLALTYVITSLFATIIKWGHSVWNKKIPFGCISIVAL